LSGGLSVSIGAANLSVGQTIPAILRDGSGVAIRNSVIAWSSSNTGIVTVSEAGVVTAVAVGTTQVTAVAMGQQATATVTVAPGPAASVAVGLGAYSTRIGDSVAAIVAIHDANGAAITDRPVTWASTNESVAKISAVGTITTFGVGTASITATVDSVVGSAVLTVTPPAAAVVVVNLESPKLVQGRTAPASVMVKDSAGNVMVGHTISWSTSDPKIATVTESGEVHAISPGNAVVTAVSDGAVGTAALTVTGTPTVLVMAAQPVGVAQSGVLLPRPPVVALHDAANNASATPGVAITATLSTGDGTLSGSTVAQTDANGVATFTNLIITGDDAFALSFSAADMTSATSSIITIGPPPSPDAKQLAIATQPSSSAKSGSLLAQQPTVQLRDAANNPVNQAGVAVSVSIAAGGGVLNGTQTVKTNASGVAVFTDLGISGASGARTLAFIAAGLSGATSAGITLAESPPTKLAVSTQPSAGAVSGTSFSQQPVIQVRDALDNGIHQSGIAVTAAIASGSGGTLAGTSTVTTDANGVATFSDLNIAGSGNFTVSFTSSGLSTTTSSTITVTTPAPPSAPATQLRISTQPSASATSAVALAQQPVIRLADASNGAVSQAGIVITAAIVSGTGTLGGSRHATTNSSGVATFTGLKIVGSGPFTLSFSATDLAAATSSPIVIGGTTTSGSSAQVATQLSVATQPSSSATSGATLAQQPVVRLADASNSAVGQPGVVVTATLNSEAGGLGGTSTATTNASGVATFTGLTVTGNGTYAIVFSATGLTGATSSAIAVAPPASVAPTSGCSNQPGGYTTINDQPWDQKPVHGSSTPQGWIDDGGNGNSAFSITNDATSPAASSNHNVISALFPAGSPGGSATFNTYRPFASSEQYKNIYICLYLKHDADFDNTNGNTGSKFIWPAGDQVGGTMTYTSHDHATMDFAMIQQGPVDRIMEANLNFAAAEIQPLRGTWVKYEMLLRANTDNSTANGTLDIWINGTHTHSYNNVNWQMGASRTWQSLSWNPTYGGGLNPVPHNQYQYMDNIHISGSNSP
jgi:adhesin/invasin